MVPLHPGSFELTEGSLPTVAQAVQANVLAENPHTQPGVGSRLAATGHITFYDDFASGLIQILSRRRIVFGPRRLQPLQLRQAPLRSLTVGILFWRRAQILFQLFGCFAASAHPR